MSKGPKQHGSMTIKACSHLQEVVSSTPKQLFAKFRHLGVFGWKHVLAAAGGNKETDRPEFGRMVERDVAWLFRLLPICKNLRLLLVFGPILRPDGSIGNLAQFLKQNAPHCGFTVSEHGDLQHAETGKVVFIHEADTRDKESVKSRVGKNLTTHRNQLLQRLDRESEARLT